MHVLLSGNSDIKARQINGYLRVDTNIEAGVFMTRPVDNAYATG